MFKVEFILLYLLFGLLRGYFLICYQINKCDLFINEVIHSILLSWKVEVYFTIHLRLSLTNFTRVLHYRNRENKSRFLWSFTFGLLNSFYILHQPQRLTISHFKSSGLLQSLQLFDSPKRGDRLFER